MIEYQIDMNHGENDEKPHHQVVPVAHCKVSTHQGDNPGKQLWKPALAHGCIQAETGNCLKEKDQEGEEVGKTGQGIMSDGFERLLVVDVMMIDHPPGYLHLFRPEPDSLEPGKKIISFHQVGVSDLVQIWSLLGYKTELLLLVTRPEKIVWSMELSPPLRCAANRAIKLVTELCQNDFVSLERSQAPCI